MSAFLCHEYSRMQIVTTSFTLPSSRDVSEMTAGALRIQHLIEFIEDATEKSPDAVFDLSRSLIDTICKSILADLDVHVPKRKGTLDFLNATINALKLDLEYSESDSSTDDPVGITANGLYEAMRGISKLRNQQGMIAHGKDAYAPSSDNIQAQFVARAADAIVHILYRTHRKQVEQGTRSRICYKDYETENRQIDESYGDDHLIDLVQEFRVSEVLYKLDMEAYRNALIEVKNESAE